MQITPSKKSPFFIHFDKQTKNPDQQFLFLCFSFGHTASQCAHFCSSGHQPSAPLIVGSISAPTWFSNTGANQHVTPDLVMITYMLVTVRVILYPILGIPCYVPLNAPLHYLTFSMFLILPNHCYMFKNFIVIIIFILNFMPLYFM